MAPLQLLIAFEGPDYAGKNTQTLRTKTWLEGLYNYEVPFISEPNDDELGGSHLGRTIRKMLKGEIERPSDPFEFQRLYVLQRGEDIACFIRPFFQKRLKRKLPAIHLMDRYVASTITYGMLSGRPAEDFIRLHKEVIGPQMIWPDLTIFLDVPAEESIRRIAAAHSEPEHFDKVELLTKVRENHLAISSMDPFAGHFAVVNGDQSEDAVFEEVKAAILPLLPKSLQ